MSLNLCESLFLYRFLIKPVKTQDLAGENLEAVLGADFRRAPLHWLSPKMNKILNQEALEPPTAGYPYMICMAAMGFLLFFQGRRLCLCKCSKVHFDL